MLYCTCCVQVPWWVTAICQEESPQGSQLAGWTTVACWWAGQCQRAMVQYVQHHVSQSQGYCRLEESKIHRNYYRSHIFPAWAKQFFFFQGQADQNISSPFFRCVLVLVISVPAVSGYSVSPADGNGTSLKCCSMASEIYMKGTLCTVCASVLSYMYTLVCMKECSHLGNIHSHICQIWAGTPGWSILPALP